MCVRSIKVPIRKKSGNLFNDPRTCVMDGKLDEQTFTCEIKSHWKPHSEV